MPGAENNRAAVVVAAPDFGSPAVGERKRADVGAIKGITSFLTQRTDDESADRLIEVLKIDDSPRRNVELGRLAEARFVGDGDRAAGFNNGDAVVIVRVGNRDVAALKDDLAGSRFIVGDLRRDRRVARESRRIKLEAHVRIGKLNFAQAQRCVKRIAFDGEDFAVCAAGAPDAVGSHRAAGAVLDLALHRRSVEVDDEFPVSTVGNAAARRHKRLLKAAQGVVGGENVPGAVEMNATHRNVIAAVDGEAAAHLKLCVARIRVAHRNGREIDLRTAAERETAEMTRIAPGAGNYKFAVIAENKLCSAQNVLRCRAALKTHKTVRQRKGAEEGRGVRIGEAELVRAAAKIDVEGAAAGKNVVNRSAAVLVERQGRRAEKLDRSRTGKTLDDLINGIKKDDVALCRKLRGAAEAAVGRERNGYALIDRRFAGVGVADNSVASVVDNGKRSLGSVS